MQVEGSVKLNAPIQKVWDFVLQASTLQATIPGAESVVRIDPTHYDAVIKQKVGPISVKMKLHETIVEMTPPTYVKIVGKGEDAMKAGSMTMDMVVNMKELAKDELEVKFVANAQIVGRLATFGERIMRAKINQTVEEFVANLQKELKKL
jgi:uncharacterized protein